ncbi:hypothetical protein POM88_048076 [Heracleum sosnowskyi]|uniref:Uncharacterized protein n=1 Tax=Heracleum sosnowskyi TaxID=360622 RepID=A0AAD8GVK6_9APIA|nr:hypothetical protein POM88_048076 [Heracleum sosnowskyi]
MAPSNPSNLIYDQFDKRIELIRRTYNEAQLQALLKILDQSLSSVSVVPNPLKKETPPRPSRNAYFYLYVQTHERLSRLNVTNLSEAPVFKLVCDFERSLNRDCLSPVVCFDVESEIFMVGDVFIEEGQGPEYCEPFFNVLTVDTAKSSSFLPCPPTIASGLAGPKVDPVVVTLQGKTYILALQLYAGQPCFEVFDNGKWETLPPPPFFPCSESEDDLYLLDTRECLYGLYAWDHKIVVCLKWGISYCFDTETVEWIDMKEIYMESQDAPILQCVAEYDKFLIAKPYSSEELVVYELDADGFPHFYQNLDELEEMFADSSIEFSTNAYIIPFNDDADKFCFICSGIAPGDMDSRLEIFLRVAIFRMTISNLNGKKKLTAVLEAHQIYPFYQPAGTSYPRDICSAFLMRDNLNLDNLKDDRSLGRACSD